MRAWLAFAFVTLAAPALAADEHPAKLAGQYIGNQTEIAAALELSKSGDFRYMLSYGALDEAAAGQWSASGDTVTLTIVQYESNDPSGDGKFGPSILKNENGVLTIARYDRMLQFRKR